LRAGEQVALLFLDLDGFKTINDSLGHDVGDEMLQGPGHPAAPAALREADTVCRLGDEFLVILPGCVSWMA
jgi:diguanylate cyclase (GGDEF)-like protein